MYRAALLTFNSCRAGSRAWSGEAFPTLVREVDGSQRETTTYNNGKFLCDSKRWFQQKVAEEAACSDFVVTKERAAKMKMFGKIETRDVWSRERENMQ